MNTLKSFTRHFEIGLVFISLLVISARFQSNIERADAFPLEEIGPKMELLEETMEFGKFAESFFSSNLITAATYGFAPGTAALEDMSSGTTQLVGPGLDDTASPVTDIGFDFWYDGVRHSQFSVNPNGLARLGPTIISGAFNNATGFAVTTNVPKIAAYFEDLCVGSNGKVHFKTVGSEPNRKLIVEWNNMKVTRGGSCGQVGGGTFQMWLFESAGTANPGWIQFVYGDGIVASDVLDGGATIGLQAGAATNFASVTTSTDTVSYDTHDPLNAAGLPTGKSYLFTPSIPTAPSGLTFGTPTATANTLNWTDNSSNEVGFAIYRSTDGTNFTFIDQTAADAITFTDTNLLPSTNYFYTIYAVTEGALSSPALAGSQMTTAGGTDTCAGAGGDWDNTATWTDGSVPTANDNVIIGTGCTVTVNVTTATALSVTIDAGGTLQSPLTGTVIDNNLTVVGNVINNGVLDFSTNGDTSAAILTFGTGGFDVTFGGTGATTDVRAITIAKGAQARVVELTATNFTVQGVNTDVAGILTLTSGTFKISGTFTMTNRIFNVAGYTIPALGGIWVNNPNFTVAGQGGSPTVTGLLRLTTGTYNVGTSTGNSLGGGTGGQFIIEGGELNTAGRFQTTSSVSYTQSGGTVNVCTVGQTATTACFGLTNTTNTFNMTGGTIVLVLPSGAATPLDYSVSSSSTFVANPAGTTLQLGNGSTPAASTFRVTGNTPNILISSGHTLHAGSGTLGGVIFFRGSTITNNGAIAIQGTSSRFDFAASGPMTYGGTGMFGTAVTPFAGVGISANGDNTTLNAPIFVNRANFFSGGFVNSHQISFGDGGASTTVIQVGNSTTPTDAGTFDVAPNYNSGSGGHIVLHLRTTTMNRMTGFEINPARDLTQLTFDNNAADATLTIAGGDLTVTGTLALINGVVITGPNTLIHNGAATRTTGFVDGNLSRSYTATGAYTYHVGQNGYSPVLATVTTLTTNPSSLTVTPVDMTLPGLNPANAASRYWNLTENGDLTADLAFTYLDDDVNGNEADYRVFKLDGGVLTNQCSGGPCVNEATNTATVTGISDFSDWGIGEASAAAPGELAFDNAAYSVNEDAGSATITVNRTGGSAGTVTVDYATVAGGSATGGASCTAGIDYINASGTLTFVNGDTTETFTVTVCPDSDVEGDEAVNLALTNPTGGATLGTQNTAVLTIIDVVAPSGNVVVNPGNIAYATLGEAVAAINAGTHTGSVTVDIFANTTEIGPIVLNGSGAGAASYTSLVIRAGADGVTVAGPSVQGRGLIELNGADNVTIDGDNPNTGGTNRNLNVQNTAANTVNFTSVIRIAMNTTTVNSADNNIFRNLNIVGSSTGANVDTATATTGPQNTTFGIFSGPNATGDVTAPNPITSVLTGVAAGATASNLIVSNNSFVTAARAISINGSATSVHTGLEIRDNFIGNPVAGDVDQVTAIGITVNGATSPLIADNTVYVEGFVASSAAGHGINVGVNSANTAGATIERNEVNRVRNNNPTTWSAYGINVAGIAASAHTVRNNFVSGMINNQTAGTGGFGTTFGAYGIRIASGTGHQIYHNSVHLYGAMPGTTSTNLTAAFLVVGTGQTGMDVRNNIFSNQITGGNPASPGTRNVAVYLPSGATSTMNLTLNNNAYFAAADPLSLLAKVGTVFGTLEFQVADFDPTATTPATNFRSYTSTLSAAGTNDNASFATTAPPPFTSNVDLHIPAGTATRLESGGAAVGVVDDIDLDVRNATTPDIGADEFAGNPAPANDISAVGFVYPPNGSTIPTGATFNPQARFNNNGTATQTNVTVRFRIIDSSMTVIYNQTAIIASISPLQNVDVSFPSTSIANPGAYTMEASAELAGDANPSNDTIIGSFNTVTPIGGTITVGTGETYTSLTNPGGLFEALNLAGISGNLTVNITSDLAGETGAVRLDQLSEAGAGGYTVTFKPSGAPRTITGSSAVSNGLINLHGTDRIVFDGSLSGGTDRSLTITNTQTGTSTVFWIKSASTTNGANNNTIKNCIINGTSVGTTAQTTAGILAGSGVTIGGPAEAPNNDNTVTNNWIYSVQNSLYNQGNVGLDQNWSVTNNEFGSSVEADKNRFRGMLMGNANNFVISGNLVHGVTNFTGTTGANSGIQLAFVPTNGSVHGNRITDIHNLSASGTGAFGMQLSAAVGTLNNVIANNFISDVQAAGSATVASNGHGITINAAAPTGAYQIYHNSINMNTNQASGTTAAVNLTVAVVAAGAIDLRNNILANTQTAGATRRSVHSAAPASVFSMINYNDYFSTGSVGFIGGVDRPTLADWQTATGQDGNSLAVDPLFVSPTDLHIQAGSPMINAGTPIVEVTTDIDGDPRSPTTPAIGADELLIVGQPGTLQFSSPTYVGDEDGSPFTITVTRTGGTDGAVSVDFATSDGTATGGAGCTAGVDYVSTSGTLSFANGVSSQTFNVTICNDVFAESDETLNYTLTNATGGATIGTPSSAVQTIIDDDPAAGSISVSDVRVFEGKTGTVSATFTITHTGSGFASVDYATTDGTALAGIDYGAEGGTLIFNDPNVGRSGLPTQQQTVTVHVNGDTNREANETFFLNLSNAVNSSIADDQGYGIIVDDDRPYTTDFDDDRISDFSVYRPSENRWYVRNSGDGTASVVDMGMPGDVPVPGDYNGDGRTDYALWRPSTGEWLVMLSGTPIIQTTLWGTVGDKPVQGDYDGDGKTDLAIYRPSTGEWWVRRSSDNTSYVVTFGISTDEPVQSDFDGDFKTDIAVYRDGTWFILLSSNGSVRIQNWGLPGDRPVAGDFDGDGSSDLAIFRNGDWWIFESLTGTARSLPWGLPTDIPAPADFNGDGATDIVVFRPSSGDWHVLFSLSGTTNGLHWGLAGDIPIPSRIIYDDSLSSLPVTGSEKDLAEKP